MGIIQNEIEQLKALLQSDLLDTNTKEDIKSTLNISESMKGKIPFE